MTDYRTFLLTELKEWGERRDKAAADGDTTEFQISVSRISIVLNALQRLDENVHDVCDATD